MKLRKGILFLGVWAIAILAMAPGAQACCGVNPYITDDPTETACVGQDVVISGTITGVEEWYDAYSTGPVEMTIEVSSPGGTVTTLVPTLTNLQEYKPPGQNIGRYATYDFSATYTATEAGAYTYVKTVSWTSALGWVMTQTASGTFEAIQCEGKVTGGGWFLMPGVENTNDKAMRNTFGFVAQYVRDSLTPQGNLEFQVHGGAINVKSTAITGLFVAGNAATFRGTCLVNGEAGFSFVVTVVDNAEPGKDSDTFAITVPGLLAIPPTVLDGGNIQVHK